MSFIPNPDWRAAQRGYSWHEYPHVVVLVPAQNETINIGDLVGINNNGQAVRISANSGAIPTSPVVFGVALGRSEAYEADSELYRGIPVATLGERPYVVLRKLAANGNPTTTAQTDYGKPVSLRMGANGTAVAGVLGCSLQSGGDPVHGRVVDVIGDSYLLVCLEDEILSTH